MSESPAPDTATASQPSRNSYIGVNNTWVSVGVLIVLLGVPAALWMKFGQVDATLSGTSMEIKYLREGQSETNQTLREISSKLDGGLDRIGEQVGEHSAQLAGIDAKLASLEQWRQDVERRLAGK